MYAIIEDSGTQIKVTAGDVIDIDLRTGETESDESKAESRTISFDRVLMLGDSGDGATTTIGTPYISGASVTAEVLDEIKSRKIDVIKFRRRKGYRRKQGHRQQALRVRITAINA